MLFLVKFQVTEAESLPEPESTPSVVPGETGALPENETSEEITIPVGGFHIPVPTTDDDGESGENDLFGDVWEFGTGHGNNCWENDVTPENSWEPSQLGLDAFHSSTVMVDEMILLASEQPKKRVEVRLKDLGEREQRLFSSAKHKEMKAWLHHGTVRKVAGGRIPEHALMR